jgi:anaerobic magnesium-protoporphyrin IX monomethyl ester cyclase
MSAPTAVLIGFQEQGNLGMGYVASMLVRRAFAVRILDFRERRDSILETIRSANPVLVGFSLIFQYYIPQFASLASYLRDNGVTCHFCAGGHYPSLRYEHVLRSIPELDSIVRFEGEITCSELMQCLLEGRDWRRLSGLAYRQGDRFVATEPRPLISDLDELPFPERPMESALTVLGKKASPVLASRGCCRDCSFCSIHQFYGQVPGKKVRVRRPARVTEELKLLWEENGTSIFLFQDDDFPVWGNFGQRWIAEFIDTLQKEELIGKVIWKISCRSDEVNPRLFARMRNAGLSTVYLGIESGNEDGLRTLNKRLSVEDSLRAVATLNQLGLGFIYGFMLFDPSSTFDSLRENLRFLQQITADGNAPIGFSRMLPYAGTPIEGHLAREGRLRGSVDNPDYDFLDPRLNHLFEVLNGSVSHWMHGSDALANQLTFAWQEYWVLRRLFPPVIPVETYATFLRSITRRCNDYLLDFVKQVINAFETDSHDIPSSAEFTKAIQRFGWELVTERDAFILANQQTILTSLSVAPAEPCSVQLVS